ncbi:membrane-spanning 4-domains subfamily A member 15-like [Zootoca vivipara]|uniref:membrane-spanning 4-domains subfamily A member 15-like n=1 Tax=Zootoca vivipara TaxID=8524 RepID=UPI00158FCFD2|nr:membrane-spanning 4-domains subfamily A member 15-like [Zootoca vivipara]XP_034981340.1 membrane-spanning 4-domains subfamily A member 15-like [Zootoca vivipara]XP_034981420.1 membrane-spanning 4-domains subfamily A member 15-like [Zootoca vivipara]
MDNQAFVVIPQHGVMASHPNHILYPTGAMHLDGQPLGAVYSRSHLYVGTEPAVNLGTERRGEPRVLGAIQILIGFVHISFGSLLTLLLDGRRSQTVPSGYVYWGGFIFIISGSALVITEHNRSSLQMKVSTCLNIVSILAAAVGIIVLIIDENLSPFYYTTSDLIRWRVALGLFNVILIFAILELFIGMVSLSFGYEAVSRQGEEAIYDVPEAVIPHQGDLLPIGPPPSYEAHANPCYEPTSQGE